MCLRRTTRTIKVFIGGALTMGGAIMAYKMFHGKHTSEVEQKSKVFAADILNLVTIGLEKSTEMVKYIAARLQNEPPAR